MRTRVWAHADQRRTVDHRGRRRDSERDADGEPESSESVASKVPGKTDSFAPGCSAGPRPPQSDRTRNALLRKAGRRGNETRAANAEPLRTTRISANRMAILPSTTMSMLLQDWRGTGPPHSRRAIPARGCGSAGAFGSGRATPKSPKLLIAPQVADETSKWTMPLSSTTSIAPRHLSGHHTRCSTSHSSTPLSLQRRWGRWCWRALHRVRQESASNANRGTQAILLARSSLQRLRVHKRG